MNKKDKLTAFIPIAKARGSLPTKRVEERQDIVALYMHEPYSYSAMVREGNKLVTEVLK